MYNLTLLSALTLFSAAGPAAQQSPVPAPVECREWHECRQLALDAFGRGDYERFHDLAWRTVQTGPPRNPDLMYLLARAQSLSGRPHDALVMLARLAEKGVASDALRNAITSDEFRGVRVLRDWPAVEALVRSGGSTSAPGAPSAATSPAAASPAAASPAAASPAAASPAAASPVAPPRPGAKEPVARPPSASPSPAGPPSSAVRPGVTEEALRLPSTAWNPTGLAYDRVSARFVLADRSGRKLLSVDERSHHLVDLVGAESAGFYEITALEIDGRRGDLWVVSASKQGTEEQPATVLHRLQLISGRPRAAVPLPAEYGAARFEDVGVTARGTVFVLDGPGARIFRLSADGHSFSVAATLPLEHATSLAPVDDNIIYVANAKGIVRIDAAAGTSVSLRGRKGVSLEGFERIRWNVRSLIGVQRLADGTRRVVSLRVELTGKRPLVAALKVVEPDVAMTDPAAAALSEDVFYFVTRDPQTNGPDGEIIVRRARLR